MSDPRRSPETDLDAGSGDAELVRRIAQHYRPRDPSPVARVAFRAAIDARIRRRARTRVWVAGVAAAAVSIAILLRGALPSGQTGAPVAEADAAEALLAFAVPAAEPEVLPADYQAIDDLLLEGEGV